MKIKTKRTSLKNPSKNKVHETGIWHSTHSSNVPEQNGPLILGAPGAERCFRSNASLRPQRRASACDPMIDEGLNGALWKRKAKEEMPPISQPLISNKCRTKWSLNTTEAGVCVCERDACAFIHAYMCVCAAKMCTFL